MKTFNVLVHGEAVKVKADTVSVQNGSLVLLTGETVVAAFSAGNWSMVGVYGGKR